MGDQWRCDLLVQVDAGDVKDRMKDEDKIRLLRPGGLYCVLWAMNDDLGKEDLSQEPVRFCYSRLERRLNDWVSKAKKPSGPTKKGDPRMQHVRHWRTYRNPDEQKVHEDFMLQIEREKDIWRDTAS